MKPYKNAYKIPVTNITSSTDQTQNSDMQTKWTKLTATDHWYTALIPSSSPPVIVGGVDTAHKTTADIKMFNNSNKS